jgi:hypothetical protein
MLVGRPVKRGDLHVSRTYSRQDFSNTYPEIGVDTTDCNFLVTGSNPGVIRQAYATWAGAVPVPLYARLLLMMATWARIP